jgi:hypothetical protein
MTAEFDASQFDASGINFKKVEDSFIDGHILPILHDESERYTKKGIPPSVLAGKRTKNSAYHAYRCRIMAFSNHIYPSIVTTDYRSNHLATGMIYADRLFTLGWMRRHAGGYKTRGLRFGIGEQINLEGPLAIASNPLSALEACVDDRYYTAGGPYWESLPPYGRDDDDKSTFMLGVGLVCKQAGLVETRVYDGTEQDRAIRQMEKAIVGLT